MIVDITTRSDSDFVRSFVYQTNEPVPVPIDLTGSKLRMMARVNPPDATASLDLSTENGNITITDATGGKFTIMIPYEVAVRLPPQTYEQSLIRTRPDDLREEIWHGTLTHIVGPTRWT